MKSRAQWMLAVVALFAHLGALVHATSATHIQCPEHGEWIDARPAVSKNVGTPSVAVARLALHQHEHCSVAGIGRSAFGSSMAPCAETLPILAIPVGAAEAEVSPCDRHRLLLN